MAEVFQDAPPPHRYDTPRKKSSKKAKIFFFLLLLLLIGGAFSQRIAVKNLFISKPAPTATPAPTPEPTEIPTPTPTPEDETSTSPKKVPTKTPTPVINPVDKTTGLDRSDLSIEIQNGSGQAGVARKASDLLKGVGYTIATTGNANNFDYENVTITVKNSKSAYLPLLKSDLSGTYSIGSSSATLSDSSSADAVVIIGK